MPGLLELVAYGQQDPSPSEKEKIMMERLRKVYDFLGDQQISSVDELVKKFPDTEFLNDYKVEIIIESTILFTCNEFKIIKDFIERIGLEQFSALEKGRLLTYFITDFHSNQNYIKFLVDYSDEYSLTKTLVKLISYDCFSKGKLYDNLVENILSKGNLSKTNLNTLLCYASGYEPYLFRNNRFDFEKDDDMLKYHRGKINVRLIKLLVEKYGCDARVYNYLPIYHARYNLEAVKYFIKDCGIHEVHSLNPDIFIKTNSEVKQYLFEDSLQVGLSHCYTRNDKAVKSLYSLQMMKIFKQHGADLCVDDNYLLRHARDIEITEYLVKECQADINADNVCVLSDCYAQKRYLDVKIVDDKFKRLLELGADINNTKIITYNRKGNREDDKHLLVDLIGPWSKIGDVKTLLRYGADPNVDDHEPLMHALVCTELRTIIYLLDYHAVILDKHIEFYNRKCTCSYDDVTFLGHMCNTYEGERRGGFFEPDEYLDKTRSIDDYWDETNTKCMKYRRIEISNFLKGKRECQRIYKTVMDELKLIPGIGIEYFRAMDDFNLKTKNR